MNGMVSEKHQPFKTIQKENKLLLNRVLYVNWGRSKEEEENE